MSRSLPMMKEPPVTDLTEGTIKVNHSRSAAVGFSLMAVGFGVTSAAVLWYLRGEIPRSISFPLPLIVGFPCMFLVMLHVAKYLLRDAGKVAITIGPAGVKFDRYMLIN